MNICQPKLRSEKFEDDDNNNDDDDDNNFYNVKESGIYQPIRPNCNKSYIGHHNIYIFFKDFKAHFQLFKHGNDKSVFSQYLIKKWTLDGPH